MYYKQDHNGTSKCSIRVTGHSCLCGRVVACRCPPSPSCLAADGWLAASGAKRVRQEETTSRRRWGYCHVLAMQTTHACTHRSYWFVEDKLISLSNKCWTIVKLSINSGSCSSCDHGTVLTDRGNIDFLFSIVK